MKRVHIEDLTLENKKRKEAEEVSTSIVLHVGVFVRMGVLLRLRGNGFLTRGFLSLFFCQVAEAARLIKEEEERVAKVEADRVKEELEGGWRRATNDPRNKGRDKEATNANSRPPPPQQRDDRDDRDDRADRDVR